MEAGACELCSGTARRACRAPRGSCCPQRCVSEQRPRKWAPPRQSVQRALSAATAGLGVPGGWAFCSALPRAAPCVCGALSVVLVPSRRPVLWCSLVYTDVVTDLGGASSRLRQGRSRGARARCPLTSWRLSHRCFPAAETGCHGWRDLTQQDCALLGSGNQTRNQGVRGAGCSLGGARAAPGSAASNGHRSFQRPLTP